MAKQQSAAVITKYNDDDPSASLEIIQKDVPSDLKDGEVLVRMMLRPINPSDMFCMRGRYGGFKPGSLPAVPGLEGLGVVAKLGPKTGDRVKEGQRVVAVPWPTAEGEGTYQQYVATPEKNLVVVPDNVDDDMAAQFLINPVTAYGFLEVIQVPEGKYLLQQAANSVLGKELICMAQKRGTKTINLVRRHEVVDELKQLGAEEVLVTTDEDVVDRVMQITDGEGAWASINPIGGEASRYLPACVKFPLDQAVEAVRKAMNGVGGQGKVMLEDKFSASEE
ncbi:hypothetical protein ABBQ32_001743 [Trebouxia sp. C0010 RCD-2024]